MGDAIVVLIIAVGVLFGVRELIRRGKGGCCGCSVPKTPEKKLEGEKVGEKIVTIEGMHCENCKNSVEREINRIDGAVAKVNLRKHTARVSMSRMVEDEELIRAVERADFKVVKIDTV